jgi:hypothetical protein
MKRVLLSGILAASVAAAGVNWWYGSQFVYSLNVVSYINVPVTTVPTGWVPGPSWHIGSTAFRLGYSEQTNFGFPNEKGESPAPVSYTDFELGVNRIRARGDIYTWRPRLEYFGATLGIGWFFWILTMPRRFGEEVV